MSGIVPDDLQTKSKHIRGKVQRCNNHRIPKKLEKTWKSWEKLQSNAEEVLRQRKIFEDESGQRKITRRESSEDFQGNTERFTEKARRISKENTEDFQKKCAGFTGNVWSLENFQGKIRSLRKNSQKSLHQRSENSQEKSKRF